MLNENIYKEIVTRQDFVSFVYTLSENYRNQPDSWQNKSIESFLESLAAWVEDMDGYYLNLGKVIPKQPDWKMIADMLLAAKTYE